MTTVACPTTDSRSTKALRPTRLALGAILAAVLLAPVPGALGQTPTSLNAYADRSNLSPSDIAAIQAYATEWGAQLGRGTATEDVHRAQRRLLDPVGLPGVSEVFRDEYGRALIPQLAEAIGSDDPHRAVNAMIVLGQLRTDRSLDELLDHCDVDNEKRVFVRQAAALSARSLLQRGLASSNPRRITAATRRLRDAARDEPEMLVLERLLTALAAADNGRLDADATSKVRSHLIEALTAAARRAGEVADAGESMKVLAAMQPSIAVFRNTFINLRDLELQRSLGRDLAPAFGDILEVPADRWDEFRAAQSMDRNANTIGMTESFLRFADRIVRPGGTQPPESALRRSWLSNDPDEYRRVLDAWGGVLAASPY